MFLFLFKFNQTNNITSLSATPSAAIKQQRQVDPNPSAVTASRNMANSNIMRLWMKARSRGNTLIRNMINIFFTDMILF